MKITIPHLILSALALVGVAWLSPILPLGAENAANSDELLPLVQSISGQQKLIDENQANIDKSLAAIQENLRQAKIYISRAGGGNSAR